MISLVKQTLPPGPNLTPGFSSNYSYLSATIRSTFIARRGIRISEHFLCQGFLKLRHYLLAGALSTCPILIEIL